MTTASHLIFVGACSSVAAVAAMKVIVATLGANNAARAQGPPAGWRRHADAALLPFFAVVAAPSLLLRFAPAPDGGGGGARLMFGADSTPPLAAAPAVAALVMGAAGVILNTSTFLLFHGAGGTSAPWDPPKGLVVSGSYAHVRNPMLSGVLLMLLSRGTLTGQPAVLGFAAGFFALNTLSVAKKEEPQLRERFGAEYDAYCREVPRLIPRISAYRPKTE